ncbi:hypothetical protein JMUB6875_24350 [Nocardia sp. JMUB6875]|uniref:hypothetical protein n=1 Tax=Nocardia sp. JMUB6875 TaxID=3158170 RepID=UPI0032E6AD7D
MTSGNDRGEQNPDWWQGPAQQPGHVAPQPDQPGYGPQPTNPLPGGPYGQNYPSGPYQPAQPQYPPTQAFGGPPPGYGGQQPPYPPPAGGKRPVWLFVGLGALVVAIIAAVVVVALVNSKSDEPSAKSTTTPSLISALTSTTAKPTQSGRPSATKTTGAKPTTTPTAVIPGFQVVTIPDNGAAYDIPSGWKVEGNAPGTLGTGADAIDVAGLADDGVNYCTNSVRTNVFLTQSEETDPAKAAADIGARVGRLGWTSTGSTPGSPESFQSSDGQLQGVYLETKGNATAPAAGCASTYSVYTFAFPGDNGAFVFTIAADTGVAQAVDTTLAKQILASIRPIQ